MDLRVVHTLEIGANLQNAIRLPNGKFVVSDCNGKLFLIDNELKKIEYTYEGYTSWVKEVVYDENGSSTAIESRQKLLDQRRDLLYSNDLGFIYVADTNCIKQISLDINGDPDRAIVPLKLVETSSTPFGLVLLDDNSLLFCVLRTIFHLNSDLRTITKVHEYETTYEIQDLTLLPDGNVWLALYATELKKTLIWKLNVKTSKLDYVKSYKSGTLITSIIAIQSSVAKPAIVTIGSRTNETSTTEFIELQQVHKFASLPIHIHAKEQFKIRSFLQLSESDFLAVCSNKLAIMGVRDAGSMNVAFKKNSPLSPGSDVYDHVQSFLPAAVAKEGGGGGGAGDDERSGSGNGKPGPKKQKLEHAYHAQQLQLRFNRALKW